MQCDNLKSFSELADSFGMKFSSSESKQSLFELLQKAAKMNKPAVNGELDDDALSVVSGGELVTGLLATIMSPWLLVGEAIEGDKGSFSTKQALKNAWTWTGKEKK